jgi:hypothetical protein
MHDKNFSIDITRISLHYKEIVTILKLIGNVVYLVQLWMVCPFKGWGDPNCNPPFHINHLYGKTK